MTSQENREKGAQILFETFGIPAYLGAIDIALSCYCSGRTTGTVVDIGLDSCRIASLSEGYIYNCSRSIFHMGIIYFLLLSFLYMFHARVPILDVGGWSITEGIGKALKGYGYTSSLDTIGEKDVARDIKQKYSYVALDYEKEVAKMQKEKEDSPRYELPDGNVVDLYGMQETWFKVPENILLNPYEKEGIHRNIFYSIMNCKEEIRKELFNNIILSGGGSMVKGLKERIQLEMSQLSHTYPTKVIAPPERLYATW